MRFTVMTVLAAAYMCRTRFAMVRFAEKTFSRETYHFFRFNSDHCFSLLSVSVEKMIVIGSLSLNETMARNKTVSLLVVDGYQMRMEQSYYASIGICSTSLVVFWKKSRSSGRWFGIEAPAAQG